MHETVIAENLIRAAARECAGRAGIRLRAATVEIGLLSGINPAALRLAVEALAPRTPLEGARLEIREIPPRGFCPSCGREQPLAPGLFECPACGGPFAEVRGGRELELVQIEVEETAAQKVKEASGNRHQASGRGARASPEKRKRPAQRASRIPGAKRPHLRRPSPPFSA